MFINCEITVSNGHICPITLIVKHRLAIILSSVSTNCETSVDNHFNFADFFNYETLVSDFEILLQYIDGAPNL